MYTRDEGQAGLAQLKLTSHSPEKTRQIGAILGQQACAGDVFLLRGPLGAGKTCLVQGLAFGLGVKEYARSPTFVIATRYLGRLTLHHIDLFRIEDPLEAEDLGLEEYLGGDDVAVVEWADRAPQLFPRESLWIDLEYGAEEDQRIVRISAPSTRYRPHLRALGAAFRVAAS